MKKLTCLLLCVLLVCFTAAPALADVIWEPYEDSFYAKHSGECKSVSSNYIVNSPTDSVTVYESPLSETQKSVFNNGATIYIGYTWTDTAGKVWGVVEYEDSANGIPNSVWYNGDTGWLDMADMVRMYNANDFWTDHETEFTSYNEPQTIPADKVLLLWTYPGSGETSGSIDYQQWGWKPDDEPTYSTSWTDKSGLQWAYVSYYYACTGWICLSDPNNENLPVTKRNYNLITAEPTGSPSSAATEAPTQVSGLSSGLVTVLVLVAAVAAVTTVVIVALCRKKKNP